MEERINGLKAFFVFAMCFFFIVISFSSSFSEEKKAVQLSADSKEVAGKSASEVQQKQEKSKLIAYYFHGNVRCPTCMKLEEYTKESINNGFQNEIEKGEIEFKSLNIEEDANKHFINDYNLISRSVVLSKIENGKETEWKNLDMIWHLVNNHDKFIEYVRGETIKMRGGKS